MDDSQAGVTKHRAYGFDDNTHRISLTRYGWLGGKQRSSATPSGVTLMGVLLYDPTSERFMSVDRFLAAVPTPTITAAAIRSTAFT
ncbi:hypothetical protein SHO565_64350 [Streptomyces sp. HO565]